MRKENFCRTEPGPGGGLEKGNFSEFGACESGNRGLGDFGSNIKYVYHIQSTGKQKEGVAHTGKGKKRSVWTPSRSANYFVALRGPRGPLGSMLPPGTQGTANGIPREPIGVLDP